MTSQSVLGKRRAVRMSAVIVGLATLGLFGVGLNAAAGAATIVRPSHSMPPATLRPGRTATSSSSSYLAGYQAAPAGGLASASVAFKVPAVTCDTTGTFEYMFFGVYTDGADTYALILADCDGTDPVSYDYWLHTPAGDVQESGANAGDQVVTSLFQSSSTTEAEVHDLTSGVYWFADDSGDVGDTTIDIGANVNVPSSSVPTFASTTMSNAQVNGDYLGFESPTRYYAKYKKVVLIQSGILKTVASGTSFTLTFKNSI